MDRFQRAYDEVRVHEGGYVNNPKDPGGATNKGVTQRVYDSYRRRNRLSERSVRHITEDEVAEIYRRGYWLSVNADQLPDGVAYCVFDAAINSGASRAARWLQECVGAKVDGIVGNETISRTMARDPVDVINQYCDKRLAFMKRLAHWGEFKNGWTRRVSEVRNQSIEWARREDVKTSDVVAPGKAMGDKSKKATIMDTLKDPAAMSGISGVIGGVGVVSSGEGPIQYAVAAVLVIAALGAIVWLVRRGSR